MEWMWNGSLFVLSATNREQPFLVADGVPEHLDVPVGEGVRRWMVACKTAQWCLSRRSICAALGIIRRSISCQQAVWMIL